MLRGSLSVRAGKSVRPQANPRFLHVSLTVWDRQMETLRRDSPCHFFGPQFSHVYNAGETIKDTSWILCFHTDQLIDLEVTSEFSRTEGCNQLVMSTLNVGMEGGSRCARYLPSYGPIPLFSQAKKLRGSEAKILAGCIQ